jgi:hypothetical protein
MPAIWVILLWSACVLPVLGVCSVRSECCRPLVDSTKQTVLCASHHPIVAEYALRAVHESHCALLLLLNLRCLSVLADLTSSAGTQALRQYTDAAETCSYNNAAHTTDRLA